ncbi:hypothetical protein [Haladaptatus sp. W1]|uniref:hypothetical protein n=1 Tax=Haladaptatus sp. W1 TaxID=1897478 RepID=UPI0009F392F4|nr:hypothetical protein [Haladaptatus sp. W1]
MANSIKRSGDGLALQITKSARAAGLVEETEDGNASYRADIRVHAFCDLLLIVDLDRVNEEDEAEMVATTIRDTKTAYQSINAGVHIAGEGYQVHLPVANDAGFEIGDIAPVHPAPNVLVISVKGSTDSVRLAKDLVSIRKEQVRSSGTLA